MQRWSLLTSTAQEPQTTGLEQPIQATRQNVSIYNQPHIRFVVANPSSYAYLTPLRYVNDNWTIPSSSSSSSCPGYNQWEWGLELGTGKWNIDYVNQILSSNAMTNNSHHCLIKRFSHRHVTYLIGGLDRCNQTNRHRSDNIDETGQIHLLRSQDNDIVITWGSVDHVNSDNICGQ